VGYMNLAADAIADALKVMPPGFSLKQLMISQDPTALISRIAAATQGGDEKAITQKLQRASNAISTARNGMSKSGNEVITAALETQLDTREGAANTLRQLRDESAKVTKEADTAFRLSNGAPVGMLYRALKEQ
jgi:hypothetical protein